MYIGQFLISLPQSEYAPKTDFQVGVCEVPLTGYQRNRASDMGIAHENTSTA